jgi:hypothetical protein
MTTQNEMHGLVRPWERGRSFGLERLPPSPELERIIERHWIVEWDLRGRPAFRQQTLPHPSVNLVIEPRSAWVWGVPTERDTRTLHGQGWAVGRIRLSPGTTQVMSGARSRSKASGPPA